MTSAAAKIKVKQIIKKALAVVVLVDSSPRPALTTHLNSVCVFIFIRFCDIFVVAAYRRRRNFMATHTGGR